MISDASVAYFEEECALAVDPLSFDVRDASGIVPACQGMCVVNIRRQLWPAWTCRRAGAAGCRRFSTLSVLMFSDVFEEFLFHALFSAYWRNQYVFLRCILLIVRARLTYTSYLDVDTSR